MKAFPITFNVLWRCVTSHCHHVLQNAGCLSAWLLTQLRLKQKTFKLQGSPNAG